MATTVEMMQEWLQLKDELARIKDREMTLRRALFGTYFKTPVEGTNKVALGNGWVLNGKYVLTRKIDQGLLQAASDDLRANGINVDTLVNWKPDLVTSVYRKLTDGQRHLFDQVLEIKEGSPSLELVPPKEGS